MKPRSYVLGLTGSIGMGKSTTAQMFRDLGVAVWDADQVVGDLYSLGGKAILGLAKINPTFVVSGMADREAMKRAIAEDPQILTQVEALVHPMVQASRTKFLNENSKSDLVVLDIPLLYETRSQSQMDGVLVVTAPARVQRDRVLGRGSMTVEMFEAILAKQIPDAQKRSRADYVIETLTLEATKAAVTSLVEQLRDKYA